MLLSDVVRVKLNDKSFFLIKLAAPRPAAGLKPNPPPAENLN